MWDSILCRSTVTGLVGLFALVLSGMSLANPPFRVNVDADGVAIHGADPVAYQLDGKAVIGDGRYFADWAGAHWRFASAAHRDAFEHDPERYAPAFGGFCAYAMSLGQFADIDPDAWSVIDGRLYLNYSLRVRELWRPRAAEFIPDAEQYWRILGGS